MYDCWGFTPNQTKCNKIDGVTLKDVGIPILDKRTYLHFGVLIPTKVIYLQIGIPNLYIIF